MFPFKGSFFCWYDFFYVWSEARASQALDKFKLSIQEGKQLIIHYLKVTELFIESLFRLCCSFCYVTIANSLLFWMHALYISPFLYRFLHVRSTFFYIIFSIFFSSLSSPNFCVGFLSSSVKLDFAMFTELGVGKFYGKHYSCRNSRKKVKYCIEVEVIFI